jgi:3',5'-cyclic-AMP phosphodiesterase
LHVTDPHLFADPASDLRGTVTQDSLQRVLDHIRAADWPADMVAVTGDLIQDDSAAAYEQFCDQFSTLGLPIHCIPGNHDVRELMQNALQRPLFHYCDAIRLGNWTVVGIDSCLSGTAAGEISQTELARLRGILDETKDSHVLVCLHHPPVLVGSKWLDSVGLRNAEEFMDLIGQYRQVRGAVFGHVHQALDQTCNGARIIGTPSTCRQFKRNSDEFAVDDNPPAYRRLHLLRDGTIDDQLIWLDA